MLSRDFIRSDLLEAARENPDVEFIVRRLKSGKAGLVKGHYGTAAQTQVENCNLIEDVLRIVNGRDKVVCVNTLDRVQVGKKVRLVAVYSAVMFSHVNDSYVSPCLIHESLSTFFYNRMASPSSTPTLVHFLILHAIPIPHYSVPLNLQSIRSTSSSPPPAANSNTSKTSSSRPVQAASPRGACGAGCILIWGRGRGGVGVGVGIAYDEGGLALESGERRQVSGRRARLGYCRLRVVI